jgi:hypothetical protein
LLAEAYIELGRTDEALELCDAVIDTSLKEGRRRVAIHALVMKVKGLAATRFTREEFAAAVAAAESEITETGALGYSPFLLESQAIRDGTEESFQTARAAFLDLGAPLRAERCNARQEQ